MRDLATFVGSLIITGALVLYGLTQIEPPPEPPSRFPLCEQAIELPSDARCDAYERELLRRGYTHVPHQGYVRHP